MSSAWCALVERERSAVMGRYPAADPIAAGESLPDRCPLHPQEPVGSVTRICARCRDEAWQELAARFARENPPPRLDHDDAAERQEGARP